nr:hypothetical protein [Acidipropionibacterium timonense]
MEAVILGVLVVAWIAYLVPWFVNRHREQLEDVERPSGFPETMTVVSQGGMTITSDVDEDAAEVEVSTPYTRSWARRDLRLSWARAARRRRNTLLVLTGATVLAAVLGATSLISWWFTAVCGLLLVGFIVLARVSVVGMARRMDARMALIDEGWDEVTTVIEVPESFRRPEADYEATEYAIDLTGPVEPRQGSLWDAVPVTAPTYVSQPLMARTVRTIDLSAPGAVLGETTSPVALEAGAEGVGEESVETSRIDVDRDRESA